MPLHDEPEWLDLVLVTGRSLELQHFIGASVFHTPSHLRQTLLVAT